MNCIEWDKSFFQNGYGRAWLNGKSITAHRAAWIKAFGEINNSKIFVCHKCDNRKCINIDHLFLGTQTDNMKDMMAKGRHSRGVRPNKTHCKNGHGHNDKNTYIRGNTRSCRKCWTERRLRYYYRDKALA